MIEKRDKNGIAQIESVREHLHGVTWSDVIRGESSDASRTSFDELVMNMAQSGKFYLPHHLASKIIEDGSVENLTYEALDQYCLAHFGDEITMPDYCAAAVLLVFPQDLGIWCGEGITRQMCPKLAFDGDQLLFGQADKLRFTKEGVLTEQYYIPYREDIERYNLGLSRGFLEEIIRYAEQTKPAYFGLAVSEDIILAKEHHVQYLTKAYIRGPKGLSLDLLRSPRFPEYPSGSVTEHYRVEAAKASSLLFPLEKIQVMWSYREGVKSVQIEELVPTSSRLFEAEAFIANRYLHARWNLEKECFEHFDGAVRLYSKVEYSKRLAVDLRSEVGTLDYRKLFRLDGNIDISSWSDLAVRYFYGNELVEEYLDGNSSTD